jgi:hypothetical protein
MNERNKEESMVDMASRELVARRSVWPAYDIWSTRTSSDHGLFHIFALCPLLISSPMLLYVCPFVPVSLNQHNLLP